jgi:uncharacterized protein (TIGR02246 family)
MIIRCCRSYRRRRYSFRDLGWSGVIAMRWLLLSAVVVLSSIALSCARAQQTPPPEPPKDETAAAANEAPDPVRQALQAYVDAFNSHDPAAVAALWTEKGVHVNKETGERTSGRDALTKDFTELFASSPAIALSGEAEEVRMIGGDAAVVDGVTTIVAPDQEPTSSAFTAVMVKQGDKWLIDAVHESDVPTPETAREALAPLEWMVGSWQDETDGAAITTKVRWSASESFLVRSYSMARDGQPEFEGTQVIGWDPAAKQVRSWAFNSDGSFGEGVWSENGADWLIRSVYTLPDGRSASATQVLTPVDADTATVQMIAKEVDGAPEPSTDPVTMKRIADVEATAAAPTDANAAQASAATETAGVTP